MKVSGHAVRRPSLKRFVKSLMNQSSSRFRHVFHFGSFAWNLLLSAGAVEYQEQQEGCSDIFSSGQDELAAEQALNPGDKVGPHFADGLETEHQSCCTRCAFACGLV